MEVFTQFASDLDDATKAQLAPVSYTHLLSVLRQLILVGLEIDVLHIRQMPEYSAHLRCV